MVASIMDFTSSNKPTKKFITTTSTKPYASSYDIETYKGTSFLLKMTSPYVSSFYIYKFGYKS